MIRLVIRAYQVLVSPILHWIGGPGAGCRFEPTCSQYFLQATERHGLWRGCWLGVRRVARCHPWGGAGFDPVPGGPARRVTGGVGAGGRGGR